MDPKKLVTTLISQHRTLQADLSIIKEDSEVVKIKAGEIFTILEKFKSDLTNHLKLENGTFYPSLLNRMKAKNMPTEDTEKFIAEMRDIEKEVMAFLEKYNSADLIKSNAASFKDDFPPLVSTLNLRIESEEDGVYETSLYI